MYYLLFFSIFNIIQCYSNLYHEYELAYQYISNSSELINTFSQYNDLQDPMCVCVSNQILKDKPSNFINEILNYEYQFLDSIKRDSIKANLINNQFKSKKMIIDIDDSLSLLSKDSVCKLIIFFSKINDNKLFADVEINIEDSYDYYYITSVLSPVTIKFLFYFEENSIKKVFYKIAYR